MTSKTSTRYVAQKTEVKCSRCGQELRRLAREGFLQRRIYSLFGYYPWECSRCRSRVFVKKQYPRKKRSTVPEATSI